MTQTLEQLSAAATQGEWVADNHVITLSPATTVACLVNYNQFGDEFPIVNEAADAAFICQLVNLYRTGQLAEARDNALDEAAEAMENLSFFTDVSDLIGMTKQEMSERTCHEGAQAIRALKSTKPQED